MTALTIKRLVHVQEASALKTKGALIWDLNEPWVIDEIEIGDPAPAR